MSFGDASEPDFDFTPLMAADRAYGTEDTLSVSSSAATEPVGEAPYSESRVHEAEQDSARVQAEEDRRARVADDDAAEDERQADLDKDHGPKLVFYNRSADRAYTVGFHIPMSCTCAPGAAVDPACNAINIDIHWAVMCKRLLLDPDRLVFNDTIGDSVDLVFPWDSTELDEGELPPEFDAQEDYDDNPDVFAWWDHVGAVMRLPLHRGGQREFEMSGYALAGRVAEHVAWSDPEPMDAEQQDSCPQDDAAAAVTAQEDEGDTDEGDADEGECSTEDDEEDTFESDFHSDVDSFLRFHIYPVRMRPKGPSYANLRKQFGQNARRRFMLRTSHDGGEERLYHVRGEGETKKRKMCKTVPGMIRSKLYKYRLVLYRKEALQKVLTDHHIYHEGHNTAEPRLLELYFIKDIRNKVKAVSGDNCPTCRTFEPVKKKPIVPILTTRRGQLVMFDLTKFYVPVQHIALFAHCAP